ncbi:hypothetical protein [Mycetocola saprophilus]|uniref:hypothetical protein n=1 Tax=Mycetocola saprophilus TaxID=76636 RepID=UPI0004BE6745|nr:hypothetical protein [Mycetocola saprophilus]
MRILSLVVLGVLATVGLTGCASGGTSDPSATFCTGFQDSWNTFGRGQATDGSEESAIRASLSLQQEWEDLFASNLPDRITDLGLTSKFVAAWNATTRVERQPAEESLTNSAQILAMECSASGTEITLAPLTYPLRPSVR